MVNKTDPEAVTNMDFQNWSFALKEGVLENN